MIVKLTGPLLYILLKMDPDNFKGYVVYEKERKVIYLVILRAINEMLVTSLLWYQKFKKDLKSIVFMFNNYDPCVSNRMVNEKQHTVRFHVVDIISSRSNHKVNNKFINWLNKNYGKLKKCTVS